MELLALLFWQFVDLHYMLCSTRSQDIFRARAVFWNKGTFTNISFTTHERKTPQGGSQSFFSFFPDILDTAFQMRNLTHR